MCEARDVKDLYTKARGGEITGFTGIDSPYEPPENPNLDIKTDELNVVEAVERIYHYVLPYITY